MLLTALMWGGNAVASRVSVTEMSPMVLTTMRWLVSSGFLFLINRPEIAAALPLARRRWKYIFVMSVAGFTIFNSVFNFAAHFTTGVNLSIIQGAIPLFVLVVAFIWLKVPVGAMQGLGVLIALLGVVIVASRGDFVVLQTLSFNLGDIGLLIACIIYGAYGVGLKQRPQMPGVVFFCFISLGALFSSLPLLLIEYLYGALVWPTEAGWVLVVLVAVFPSILAHIFYIRSVDLIGPGRAGIFINLVPIFGSLLSVALLGESFGLYQALALSCVLGGIFIAEKGKLKPVVAPLSPELL